MKKAINSWMPNYRILSVVFLLFGLFAILISDDALHGDTNQQRLIFGFVDLCIYGTGARFMAKAKTSKQCVWLLAGTLLVYDVYSLFFSNLLPITYILQVLIVGLYFAYARFLAEP